MTSLYREWSIFRLWLKWRLQ